MEKRKSKEEIVGDGGSFRSEGLAVVAHDLCNQLQIISGALDLVRFRLGDDASASLSIVLNGAQTSLERAARLSRQIADGGRCAAACAMPICLVERLARLRNTLLLMVGPYVRLDFFAVDDVPEVQCPAETLEDAVLNIVGNAAHAMQGSGTIAISVTHEIAVSTRSPFAVLRIADTGCGMPPEVAARAFEPRFTTRPRGEGTGIGLAMVADFARAAGGSVELESSPGVGTVVTMRLPGVPRHARGARREAASR